MMSVQVDTSGLKKLILDMVADQDAKAKLAAEQILIEGKNVAKTIVPQPTGNLRDGIDRASYVERQSPCVYKIVMTSDAPYSDYVEFGTYKMLGTPFLRPAGMIMRVKAPEVISRIYDE